MREYFTYGSVRGAAGNGGPYRDRVRLKGRSALVVSSRTWLHSEQQKLLPTRDGTRSTAYQDGCVRRTSHHSV